VKEDDYKRDTATQLNLLHDTETELIAKTQEWKLRQIHNRAREQIRERRVIGMQGEICELTALISSLRMEDIMPAVDVIIPAVDDVIMPVGYVSTNFTCVISRTTFPVVQGIHGAFYSLRSPHIVRRMDASQLGRMIPR
jgi:hypothetical protein